MPSQLRAVITVYVLSTTIIWHFSLCSQWAYIFPKDFIDLKEICHGTDNSFCGINCPVLLGKYVASFENNVVNSYGKTKKPEKYVDMLFPKFEKIYWPMRRQHMCVTTSSTVLNSHRTCLWRHQYSHGQSGKTVRDVPNQEKVHFQKCTIAKSSLFRANFVPLWQS